MQLTVNIRHLENKDLHLQGEIPASDLEIEDMDELVRFKGPVIYDLEVERLGESILVHGWLEFAFDCECARCLKGFTQRVNLARWTANLLLEGEDKVHVDNDCVDLTPFIREDILLAFPQHPLCQTDCSGLPELPLNKSQQPSGPSQSGEVSSAWAELNKLKF